MNEQDAKIGSDYTKLPEVYILTTTLRVSIRRVIRQGVRDNMCVVGGNESSILRGNIFL